VANEPNVRPSVAHLQGAPDEDRDCVDRVVACAESFQNGIGTEFRERNLRFFRQYRGFRKWRDEWTKAGPNDQDGLVRDAKSTWGAHLHIPLSYRTIETLVPRAIAHRPHMLYLPRRERFAENVANLRLLIDSQQENIDIDLPYQAVMRSGRIYGLGVGKDYWRKEYALKRETKRSMVRPNKFYRGKQKPVCTFDDPYFEDVDIFDFMWDEYGSDMRTCNWAIHRMWPSVEQCLQRIATGAWNTASAQLLDEQKIRNLATNEKWDEIWTDRLEASGMGGYSSISRTEPRLELLEWHDGQQVYTVLGRTALVQNGESVTSLQETFPIYRPTPIQKQLVGIGDLEPLEHLQRELDTLRSQRRDAATLALCAGYAFDATAIDEEDLVFGPAAAIRVTNASPRDALMALQVKDVPATGYEEEKVIRQDFDVVSGVTDALDPNNSQAQTATEAQLVQASLSARIQLGSRRFESEVVRASARAFLHLNQAMILTEREPIRQPDEGLDIVQAAQEGRWRWFPIGPADIRGEFEVIPEGGSMAQRNIPQDRQDAQMFMQLSQDPRLDGRRPLLKALELCGIKDGESWLAQQEPPIPPLVIQLLGRAGVDPRLLQAAVRNAQAQQPMVNGGEPGTADVAAAMNGGGQQ
jgi:hypothetical protein